MASVHLKHLGKSYSNGQVAVRDLNLEVADGELLVLVGPSGCGKTTLLRLTAGLETPTQGQVWIAGQDVTPLPPHARDVAMVFQNFALYPHKSVRGNLEFGLRLRRTSPSVIAARVAHVAKMLGLEQLLDRSPGQLSGGQRQRVALGRAMVREPRAFLLDEPLSNLDAQLRTQMRAEISRVHRELGATMLYVTHDQEEAMALGDRVAVLREGLLQQLAAPREIYLHPANAFVAGFVGSPGMNLIRCKVSLAGGRRQLAAPGLDLTLDRLKLPAECAEVLLGIRPQDLRLASGRGDAIAQVNEIQMRGSELILELTLHDSIGKTSAIMVVPLESGIRVSDRIIIAFPRDRLHFFDVKDERRLV